MSPGSSRRLSRRRSGPRHSRSASPRTTGARSWSIFKGWIRTLIADYGATAAVVFFCAVPYMGDNYRLTPKYEDQGNSNMTIATLEVRGPPRLHRACTARAPRPHRACTNCRTASLRGAATQPSVPSLHGPSLHAASHTSRQPSGSRHARRLAQVPDSFDTTRATPNPNPNPNQVPDSFDTTSGRDSWLVNPLDCPVWAVFVAIAPAIILTVLFF